MVWGQTKASVIQKSVELKNTEDIPTSLLQNHDDCVFVVDDATASELTRFKSLWLTREFEWTPMMIHHAVTNLVF
jgi:glucosamine-6-phosphate deaminase